MGDYRARHLLLLPNLVSLLRVPLAGAFVLARDQPLVALSVLLIAGGSDVLDGWLARTRGEATPTGAVLDPITDKLFVFTVVATLIAEGRLPLASIPMLAARELGELPLVLWWAASHKQRRARAQHPKANIPGKIATACQFMSVTAALLAPRLVDVSLFVTALAGAYAATVYWLRELQRA
jgi:CDP-diacylglycerol--glycerol-3-phosphate 3-phosphatidyltransferase/cardiolipin synthase